MTNMNDYINYTHFPQKYFPQSINKAWDPPAFLFSFYKEALLYAIYTLLKKLLFTFQIHSEL